MIDDQQALHRNADAALGRGDHATAIVCLQAALRGEPDNIDSWMKLAAVQRAAGHLPDALYAIDKALALQPLFYLALLFKGSLLQALGSTTKAAEFFAAALFHAEGNNHSPPVVQRLDQARHMVDQHADTIARAVKASAGATMIDQAGFDRERQDRVIERLVDNVVRRRPVYHQAPTHYRYPGLADIEFFDDVRSEWLDTLEAATDAICHEYSALVASDAAAAQPYIDLRDDYPAGPWGKLDKSRDWNAVHLVRYGDVVEANARRCPVTMRLFGQGDQPRIAGLAPNLMFSVLAPRTHIPAHHGVANFRAVLHLPLIVPPNCRFRVGADTRAWVTGRPWIFDDTIEHEAWNDSDEPRVILIADLWRPELDLSQRRLVAAFMGALGTEPDIGAL